jgi:2-dehydro-3-deoxy-L-rhamnonate dehydrogenase (NAD+)
MNHIDLNHRHAIVSGGAQGIGLSIAARFLKSGAYVSLWDRDADLLKSAVAQLSEHGNVSGNEVDVADERSVNEATESTVKEHGKIDILVANAGIAGPNHKTWEYPIDAWKEVININLIGVYLCCRSIVPHMLAQNYG